MKNNPFLTDPDYLWNRYDKDEKHHHDIIVSFFEGKLQGDILDIGERNPLAVRLEKTYGVEIHPTNGDLDKELSCDKAKYDIVICSHVIEHLFNPLLFLNNVKRVMHPQAKLYIIAPIKPYWITPCRCHFHEMDMYRFRALVSAADLKIYSCTEYRVPIPFRPGIRNILRRLYYEYSIITVIL